MRASLLQDRVQVALQHIDGGWVVDGGMRISLWSGGRRGVTRAVDLPRLSAGRSDAEEAAIIRTRLVRLGLENVAVRIAEGDPGVLQVAYENRSFPHNEVDALANALATAAAYAPDHVGRLVVLVERAGLPVLRVACPAEAYRDYLAGRLDEKAFADRLVVDHQTGARDSGPGTAGAAPDPVSPKPVQTASVRGPGAAAPQAAAGGSQVPGIAHGAPFYGHADFTVYPLLSTFIGSETASDITAALNLGPELDVPIARGLGLNAEAIVPGFGQAPLLPSSTVIERVSLRYAAKPAQPLPLPDRGRVLSAQS